MGWKNALTRKVFDKRSTKPDPITIFGVATTAGTMFQSGLAGDLMNPTRHHIIPHNLLIDCWDHAVDRAEIEVHRAFAVWAGKSVRDLPGNYASVVPEPQTVLKRVAWNPFNIVIGPLGEHRVEDPGDQFDRFEFRSFLPSGATRPASIASAVTNKAENLARQELNRHFGMLRRIYNILVRYKDDEVSRLDVESLVTLLKSDVPSHYPNLNAHYVRGALLSPDLWSAYTVMDVAPDYEVERRRHDGTLLAPSTKPEDRFEKTSVKAAEFGRRMPVVVPWNSTSWLPEVEPVKPKPDVIDETDTSVWAPGEANPPYDRLLLGKVEMGSLSEAEFRLAFARAARQTGKFKARVLLFGPREGKVDMTKWTASEIKALNRDGYDFKISRTRFDLGKEEVRFYDFLRSG
jgi:hypothetical protein